MKECHTCDFHREIMAGKHKQTPWKDTPCATCPAADLTRSGRIKANRALRGRAGWNRQSLEWESLEVVEQAQAELQMDGSRAPEEWRLAFEILYTLGDVGRFSRSIVLERILTDKSATQIADEHDVEPSTAHKIIKKAMRDHDWIREAIEIRHYAKEKADAIEEKDEQ